ncbi:MAG: methyltransferase domain-containing protein [Gammaproteobacteria bacterium]|jgi:SAM-dependent methyltransferase|nr:methyltransferase domain-containing protein [Gammaproteobacteria bacterium]
MTELTPELEAIKAKQKATWGAGDYGVVAKNLEASALEFLARIPIEPGTRVLDVACGTGQMAFPAAAAGARVTGIDIAPGLIEQARARAESEGAKIRFDEGDAEALPYEDGSFDLVISLIGAMFAPRPELVASELMRVCRPGGRIVMGNWTPEGFIGSFFKAVGKHLPPPSGIRSPLEWGNEAIVRERLSDGTTDLRLTKRDYAFRYPFPPCDVVEYYRTYFGPTNRAFAALDQGGQAALQNDLEKLWTTNNLSTNGSTYLEAEILEVVAVRQ